MDIYWEDGTPLLYYLKEEFFYSRLFVNNFILKVCFCNLGFNVMRTLDEGTTLRFISESVFVALL